MFILNNFKEAKIVPNEDGTLKFEFNGVKFQDQNGTNLEEAIVTYPRVKVNYSTIDMFSPHKQINVEVLKDNDDNETLFSIFIPEET